MYFVKEPETELCEYHTWVPIEKVVGFKNIKEVGRYCAICKYEIIYQ